MPASVSVAKDRRRGHWPVLPVKGRPHQKPTPVRGDACWWIRLESCRFIIGVLVDIERLVALIVKTVIEELTRQGIIRSDGLMERSQPAVTATPIPDPAKPAKSSRRVVSAEIVLDAIRNGKSALEVPPNAIITPLAQDTAKEKGITIQRGKGT